MFVTIKVADSHNQCVVCSAVDIFGLKLNFVKEKNGVKAIIAAHKNLQGYDNIMHGGIIATLLDASMTHCLFSKNIEALTADMNIRFLHPVKCGDRLELSAKLVSSTGPLYRLEAEIKNDDKILVRGNAKFFRKESKL